MAPISVFGRCDADDRYALSQRGYRARCQRSSDGRSRADAIVTATLDVVSLRAETTGVANVMHFNKCRLKANGPSRQPRRRLRSTRVLGAALSAGETAESPLGKERHGYLVPAKGAVEVSGLASNARDGAVIRKELVVQVQALEDTELVLVDAA
jgi:Quercetinase C-terminal cupin domain